jgi:hypothetical protein
MTYQGGAAAPPVTACSWADRGCEATFRDSGKWARMRAADDGWFFTRPDHPDGPQVFCPEHNPPWVAAWRARQKNRVDVEAVKVAARARCGSCSFDLQADGDSEEDTGMVRVEAREHAATPGHVVTVTTGRRYTYARAHADS